MAGKLPPDSLRGAGARPQRDVVVVALCYILFQTFIALLSLLLLLHVDLEDLQVSSQVGQVLTCRSARS